MLFNSYEFLIFLACVLGGFYLALRVSRGAANWLLLGASGFFYAWWDAKVVLLLFGSVVVNYLLGLLIAGRVRRGLPRRLPLAIGIVFNLALIGWFKYAAFFAGTIGSLMDRQLDIGDVVLPLGISFFTFQQITYLVDTARGTEARAGFRDYALYVTFFPQLIAGPIVHHEEMLPQLRSERARRVMRDLSLGLTIFVIGLFKKVVLADSFAPYADGVFGLAASGTVPGMIDAWIGVLAYTFQIYFDFSGYSDMAVGLARMFGIRLPLNFFSPYKSQGIIEFWRRWHISLSRFLRDYLYIPLGGSRRGRGTQFFNILITMAIGGLWHGAGWTFVFWGALHGILIVGNHVLRRVTGYDPRRHRRSPLRRAVFVAITFGLIALTWVPFRATGFDAAMNVYAGMFGIGGIVLPELMQRIPGLGAVLAQLPVIWVDDLVAVDRLSVLWLVAGFLVIWAMPNTVQITARHRPVLDPTRVVSGRAPTPLIWRPTRAWAWSVGAMATLALLQLSEVSPFLYFQF